MRKLTPQRSGQRRVVALALALTLGIGVGGAIPATAAPLVGMTGVDVSTTGTHTLRLSLVKGTNESGQPAPGSVAGVTINLKRLADIDPMSPADLEKIGNTDLNEILGWPKDLHYFADTDDSGTVVFSSLPTGIYIVSSTPAAGKREVAPFLVAIPFHSAGNGHSVEGVILAKSQDPNPQQPPTPGNPPQPSTPPSGSTPPPEPPTTPPLNPPVTPPITPPATPPVNPPTNPPSSNGGLAMTGAQVISMALAAMVLIGSGAGLLVIGRRRSAENS